MTAFLLHIARAGLYLALFYAFYLLVMRLIQKGEKAEREGCSLVLLDQNTPSFSWGEKVIISRKDLQENPAILTHEQMHVQHRHSRDLILFLPLLLWLVLCVPSGAQSYPRDSVLSRARHLKSIYRMEESLENMQLNMSMIRRRKSNLVVKAPIDGELGLLDVVLGQSIKTARTNPAEALKNE